MLLPACRDHRAGTAGRRLVNSFDIDEHSSDPGGLMRWPIRLLIPVAFALLALQGLSEIIKRVAFLQGPDPLSGRAPQAGARLMSLELMAPLMFGGLVVFLLIGYPVAFSLAATGLFFGVVGMQLGLLHPSLLQALPERVLGIMANSTLLAIPFFTFMGLILERSGMAEDLLDTIGQLFGTHPRRHRLRGGLRRRAARGDHRRGRRLGARDGPDLAAGDDALRLLQAARHRRHRRLGHAGADHPAEPGADRARRPDGRLGGRPVRGRAGARADADRVLRGVRVRRVDREARGGARAARPRRARCAAARSRSRCSLR